MLVTQRLQSSIIAREPDLTLCQVQRQSNGPAQGRSVNCPVCELCDKPPAYITFIRLLNTAPTQRFISSNIVRTVSSSCAPPLTNVAFLFQTRLSIEVRFSAHRFKTRRKTFNFNYCRLCCAEIAYSFATSVEILEKFHS